MTAVVRRGLGALGRIVSHVTWYLRELTGEADYDRYVDHCKVYGSEVPPVSREQFERLRWEDRAASPGTRCC